MDNPNAVAIYNPSAAAHVAAADERWGDPAQNRAQMVKYGVEVLDKALWGVNVQFGELIVLFGKEKARKTTGMINLVVNFMENDLERVPGICIDSLESGMPPGVYADNIIANIAARLLMRVHGHMPNGPCPACRNPKGCKELRINAKFLRFGDRSKLQSSVIAQAKASFKNWPVLIFGAKYDQGDTRSLYGSVGLLDKLAPADYWHVKMSGAAERKMSRWEYLKRTNMASIFVSDHAQQYDVPGISSEYDHIKAVTSAFGNFVAREGGVVFAISQTSLTSQREEATGGRQTAAGGKRLNQEANTVFSFHYDPDKPGSMVMSSEVAREGGSFHAIIPIDPWSGAFYGEPKALPGRYNPNLA